MKEEINLDPAPTPREKIYLNPIPISREKIYLNPTPVSREKIYFDKNLSEKSLFGSESIQPQVAEPTPRLSKEALLDIKRILEEQAALGKPTPKIITIVKKPNRFGR